MLALRAPLAAAALFASVLPAVAHAAEYCVPSTAIAASCTTAKATPALAVDSALLAGGSHTIRIGPGTWAGDLLINPAAGAQITVVGAGVTKTKLTGAGSGTIIDAVGSVTVRDLTIERTGGSDGADLDLSGLARGDRLQILRSGGSSGATSVRLSQSVLTRSTIRSDAGSGYPLALSGSATADSVTVTGNPAAPASYGVTVGGSTARRLKVDYPADIAAVYSTGTSLIADSVLVARGANAAAVNASSTGIIPALVTVVDSTMVAPAGSSSAALAARSYLPGLAASISGSGAALRGFASLGCAGTGSPTSSAQVDVRASVAQDTSLQDCATDPNTGTETISGGLDVVTGDPGFVNFAGGDYRLARGALAIDRGDPLTPIQAGYPVIDFLGQPRLRDGNLDGVARRDAGAFEYQPPAVTDFRRIGFITKAQLNRTGRLLRLATGPTPALGQVRVRVSAVPTRARFTLAIRTASGAYRALAGVEELGMSATQRYISVRGKWMGSVALVRGRTYRLTVTTPSSPGKRVYFAVR